MPVLVRKIARGKWPDAPRPVKTLQADAIADLRTSGNSLSVWRIDDIKHIDDAVLALSASSKTEKIENMFIVWADEGVLQKKGIKIDSSSDGDTIIKGLGTLHRDLSELSYDSLGMMSEIIMECIEKENARRFTMTDVRKMLVEAYRNDRIERGKCTEKLYNEIAAAAAKTFSPNF